VSVNTTTGAFTDTPDPRAALVRNRLDHSHVHHHRDQRLQHRHSDGDGRYGTLLIRDTEPVDPTPHERHRSGETRMSDALVGKGFGDAACCSVPEPVQTVHLLPGGPVQARINLV
jgi:hypothetical protein